MSDPNELETLLGRAHAAGATVHVLAVDCAGAARALSTLRDIAGVAAAVAAVARGQGPEPCTILFAQIESKADATAGGQPARLGTTLAEILSERDGRAPSIGVATSLGHGDLSAEELIAVALEGLEVARTTGARMAIHSELYELTVARLRRSGAPLELGSVELSSVERLETHPITESDDPFAYQPPVTTPIPAEAIAKLGGRAAPAKGQTARQDPAGDEERQTRAVAKLRAEIAAIRAERAASENAGSEKGAQEEHSRRLERRIGKLVAQLEATEAERDRLREERDRDPGVASRFRTVQGLPADAADRPTRQSMLDGVFRSNRPADANS